MGFSRIFVLGTGKKVVEEIYLIIPLHQLTSREPHLRN